MRDSRRGLPVGRLERLVGRRGMRRRCAAMKARHYPGLTIPMPPRAVLLAAALLLSACGGGDHVRKAAAPPAQGREWARVDAADPVAANAVLMRAIGLVGTPYSYGGNTPESG